MKYNKLCVECLKRFNANRSDQVFCSTICRNAYNNSIQAKINAPYNEIAKNLKEQDRLLEKYDVNPDVLFHIDHLTKYGININHAYRYHYNQNNKLIAIEFVKYKLQSDGISLFKIVKL